MKIRNSIGVLSVAALAVGTGLMTAEAVPGKKARFGGSTGADVAVCDLPAITRWGSSEGVTAYSLGTTSVNLGDVDLLWIASTNEHPRIPQNAFRFADGRLMQIGQSWCKDGFCALQENQCGPCDPAGAGCPELLGPGCSDPYSSGINGNQSGLAPRSQCNPSTGWFQYPPQNVPGWSGVLDRRLQIRIFDLNTNAWPNAKYYADAFYLIQQDYDAGNSLNNGSYREFERGSLSSSGYRLDMVGDTNLGKPAIFAWEENSSTVEIKALDIPNDGRIYVASDVIDNGDGTWRYEYAIYNLTSDDAVNGFSIPLPAGVTATGIGFHDSPAHSGEPYANNNWVVSSGGGAVSWTTSEFADNPDANALRWATMYNMWFTADAPPADINASVEIFKTDGLETISVKGPAGASNPYDLNGDGTVDGADAGIFFAAWGSSGPEGDFNGDGSVDGSDAGLFFAAWG